MVYSIHESNECSHEGSHESNECFHEGLHEDSHEANEGSESYDRITKKELSYVIAKSGLQVDFSYKVLKEFKRNLMKAISVKNLVREEKKKLVNELYIIKNHLRPYVQRLGGVMFEIYVILEENQMSSKFFEKKVQKFMNIKDILTKISDMTQRVSKKVVV
jgi:hypothetical protein